METPFKPNIQLLNIDAEVKSYIYQTIVEFEPFSTPNTVVAVVAKDPLKLIQGLDESNSFDPKELKKLYRISISLTEDGTKLEEEGLHEDIYSAIRIAKDKLLKQLHEIQDSIISNQDRKQQIDMALTGGNVH